MAFNPPSIQNMYENRQLTSPLVQIVLLVIIIVLFSWFMIKPKLSASMAAHNNLSQLKDQMTKIEGEKRELNRLVNELQSSSQQVTLIDEALPLTGRASKLNTLIDTLAKSSGLEVAQLNVDQTDAIVAAGNKDVLKDPYKANRSLETITMSILVSGSIDQFRNFLQLLETNGRILDVTSFEVTSGDAVPRFRIKLKAYAYEAE